MDTDDIFSSSSSRSASPLKQDSSAVTNSNQSATFNDKDQTFIPSSFTDDPVLVTASSHKESTESSADRLSIGSKKDDLSSSSATLLLGARQFFKDSLVHIPDETIPNFEKHRHSASEMSELVKVVLQAANSDQVQEDEIRSKIDKLATWEYYGVELDGIPSNDEHLQLYRWRLRSVIIDGVLGDDIKGVICDLDAKRMKFKADLNAIYYKLQDEDRAKLKRKSLFDNTPAKKQKPNSANEKAKASGTSTGKKRPQKLTSAEKAAKEEERLRKIREKEEEKAKKEEEKARKEKEKAKKMEEKLLAQVEKEAAKNKASEEKARKQMEKENERKLKEEAKEAERVKKELLKQKEEKKQKKLSGFFKPLEKKDPIAPARAAVSDFAYHFHPFTPKATAIMAPINRFDRKIDTLGFQKIINSKESLDMVDVKKLFDSFRKCETLVKSCSRAPRTIESLIAPNSWRYLKFAEDVRPPYYGTWTKKSKKVTGKSPFAQDADLFDYDFDSEAEWEEDEPGEELVSEDDEPDAKEEGEEGEEEGWVVPHGYLSDDEGEQDVDEPMRGKARNLQPKVIQTLVPILCPPSYKYEGIPPGLTVEVLYKIRNPFQLDPNSSEVMKRKGSGMKKSSFPSDLISDLAKFVAANDLMALSKLVDEFAAQFTVRNLTKRAVESEIRRIAVREKRLGDAKARWHLREALLTAFSEPLTNIVSSANTLPDTLTMKAIPVVTKIDVGLDKENLQVG